MDAVGGEGRTAVVPLEGRFPGILNEQLRSLPPEAPLLKKPGGDRTAAADGSNSWQPYQNTNSIPNHVRTCLFRQP
jgi:hypothetical protein